MLDKRADILQRSRVASGSRGRGSSEPTFTLAGTINASLRWNKGMRPLREGALEAYDVVMIRMRWNDMVDRDCRIRIGKKVYQIIQLEEDYRENQIQIIAQEVVGATTIEPAPYSTPTLGATSPGNL